MFAVFVLDAAKRVERRAAALFARRGERPLFAQNRVFRFGALARFREFAGDLPERLLRGEAGFFGLFGVRARIFLLGLYFDGLFFDLRGFLADDAFMPLGALGLLTGGFLLNFEPVQLALDLHEQRLQIDDRFFALGQTAARFVRFVLGGANFAGDRVALRPQLAQLAFEGEQRSVLLVRLRLAAHEKRVAENQVAFRADVIFGRFEFGFGEVFDQERRHLARENFFETGGEIRREAEQGGDRRPAAGDRRFWTARP